MMMMKMKKWKKKKMILAMINNTFYFININLKNKIKTNYNIKKSSKNPCLKN